MLFNSLEFLVFFPLVTLIYFLLPHPWRWGHLLIASCIFYIYFIPVYILILIFTIVIDYIAGILIENAQGRKRKLFLVMSIVANVGVLSFFKYYNFFSSNVNELLHAIGWRTFSIPFLNIILPIGLSFHTFQAMSYTIEVYRGRYPAERHFGIYALYVMFYPQLVAGPIERPQNVLPQLHEKKYFDYDQVTDGLKQMMWGMFKKVVIADRLAKFTDPVFNHPHDYSPIVLLIATLFFSFQIFCDFSGYSNIALGSAKVMGFRLMRNFNKPYHSKNISEFWGRWHISLSTWFRDYLYISLGGNRVSIPRWYFNLIFVFLVSGLWHGANWTFIIWGALHGFYLIFAILTQGPKEKINAWLRISRFPRMHVFIQVFTTYCLVSFAWIFFRANNIREAFYIAGQIPFALSTLGRLIWTGHIFSGYLLKEMGTVPIYQSDIVLSIIAILFLEGVHALQRKTDILSLIKGRPIYQRWGLYYLMLILIIFFGVYENRQFIYFQF
jgi:alginate O-acetyltransferase complex protein AlgI